MEAVVLRRRKRAKPFVSLMVVGAFALVAMVGCGHSTSDSAVAKRQPQQAGKPINPFEMAGHLTAARTSAALGDTKAAEQHIQAVASGITRSARMPDVHRPIDHESARTAVLPIPGVRSSVWMDRENLVVMVGGASHRSMDMIG